MAPLPRLREADFSRTPDCSVLCLPVGRAVQIIVWAVTSTALTGCADGVPACAWLVSRTRLCSRDGFHRAGLVDSRGRSWGLQGHI